MFDLVLSLAFTPFMKIARFVPLVAAVLSLPAALLAENAVTTANEVIDTSTSEWEGIVNIDVSTLFPDYREPWNAGQPSGGSGTGFLIGKNRFLTNAHVVSDATKIVIRKE